MPADLSLPETNSVYPALCNSIRKFTVVFKRNKPGLTLVIVVVIAKFIGAVLPMVADRIGFDPAVMASPLITTIVDAISLTVYFALATRALHIAV